MDHKYIVDKSRQMFDNLKGGRNELCRAMDRFRANDWDLPDELSVRDDVRCVVDTGPGTALNTAVKVMAGEKPKLRYWPLGPADKTRAGEIERTLMWQLWLAEKRCKSSIVADIVRSALSYDEVCIRVDHLPYHFDSLKAAGKPSSRQKNALRMGDFSIKVCHPTTVYYQYDDLGLDSVLEVKVVRAREVVNLWGSMVPQLQKRLEENPEDFYVTYLDYQSHEERDVWYVEANSGSELSGTEVGTVSLDTGTSIAPSPNIGVGTQIFYEENKKGFINWIVAVGGTTLDFNEEYQRKPLLESVWRSDSWENMNILKSLLVSETIKYAGAPRTVTKTVGAKGVPVDYTEPMPTYDVDPNEDVKPFPLPPIDQAVLQTYQIFKAELDSQTQVQVLQNLNFPAGTAFASINAVLQTAISSLQPYKTLSEKGLAGMFELMLLWVDFTGRPLEAFGQGKMIGQQYIVDADSFDADNIYLTVELNASAPTDFIQRINAAMMLKQLGMPTEELLEDLNVQDPETSLKLRVKEDFKSNEASIKIQTRQAEAQMKLQGMLQGMQQTEKAIPPVGGAGVNPNPPQGQGAFNSLSGDGFNTAMGGMHPAEGAPGMTREAITGETMEGLPIAEI